MTKTRILSGLILIIAVGILSGRNIIRASSQTDCTGNDSILHAAFSADGKYIFASWTKGVALLWDAKTGKEVQTFSADTNDWFFDRKISPDNKYFVAALSDRVILWDVETGKIKHSFIPPDFSPNPIETEYVWFLPDSKGVLVPSLNTISLWNADTGKLTWRISTNTPFQHWWFSAKANVFLTDGAQIVAGPDIVTLWDLTTGQKIRELDGFPRGLSPDGKYAVVQKDDKGVLLTTDKNEVLFIYDNDEDYGAEFSPDSKFVLAFNGRSETIVLDTQKRKLVHNFGVHLGAMYYMYFFLPQEQLLLVSPDTQNSTHSILRTYAILSGMETRTVKIPIEFTFRTNVSQDGKTLLVANDSGPLTLWDIQSGRLIRRFC